MAVNSHITGHGGTTRKVAGALVVLLSHLVHATAFSTARSSTLARRGLLDSPDTPRTIAVDLMHVHHVDSPYMQGQRNLTLTERVQLSVANSKRRLQTTDVFTSPLQADAAAGEYIVQITVGTPARKFVAIADTGSDLVWLQCSNSTCNDTNCLQIPDQPFDPSASSSYIPLTCGTSACEDLGTCSPSTSICNYNYSYHDGSFTFGELADETFTFTSPGGSSIPVRDVAFGCGIDDESTTFQRTDGLVGLGQGPLSLVSQLAAQFIISHVFSYCLVDYSAAATQTSRLLLGSTGVVAKSYTPLLTNPQHYPSYYYVNLVGITVDDEPIIYPSGTFALNSSTGEGGIIVDSGTHFTYLFDAALNPLESAISSLITYPQLDPSGTIFNLCYNTSSVPTPVFPTVVFQFENVNATLGINNTFVLVDQAGTYCSAFLSGGSPADGPSFYGNVIQSHFEISYDIVNQLVGFGPDAC